MIALARHVPESREPGPRTRLDVAGAALITASLVGLTYGFTSASELGFGNPSVVLSLASGFLALVGFVVVEKRIRDPMLPLDVFKSRTFSGANLLTLFLYGALSACTLFLSLNVIQVQGYREAVAGLVLLPFVVLLAGMSRWTGRLVDRVGPKWLLTAGPFIVGVGFFLTSFAGLTNGPRDYWEKFFPAIFLFGAGMGLTVFKGAVADETARLHLPPAAREEVMGQALRFGGASVPGSVPDELSGEVELSLKRAFVDSFRVLMYLCAGLAWLSALAAVVFAGRPAARAGEPRAGPED